MRAPASAVIALVAPFFFAACGSHDPSTPADAAADVTRLADAAPDVTASVADSASDVDAASGHDVAVATDAAHDVATADTGAAATYTFDDEFTGTSLDETRWTRESGGGYGIETFSADPSLAALDGNGHLVLRAVKNSGVWTSGQLSTRGHFTMQSGVVEIRAELPTEQGAWPGMWFHNGIHGETGGPHSEIDLLEEFPGGGDHGLGAYFTLHDWSTGTDRHQDLLPNTAVTDGGFHVWRMVWTTGQITLYLDDVDQGSLSRSTFTAGAWVFSDVPMYFITQVCIQGTWTGALAPLPSTTSMQLVLDYIRITRTS